MTGTLIIGLVKLGSQGHALNSYGKEKKEVEWANYVWVCDILQKMQDVVVEVVY